MIQDFLLSFCKLINTIRIRLFYIIDFIYYKFLYKKPNIKINYDITRFIVGGTQELSELLKSYKKYFSDNINDKIKQADLICEHVFDLLGSGPVKLSTVGSGYLPINWHRDFKNKYEWSPSLFFGHIKFGHKTNADIKVPWELSYFHHLTILGQAYLCTGNDKYINEFQNEIADWIDNNKVGFGVGWYCPMIVAIRAVNWIVALEYFSQGFTLSKAFLTKFYTSIYEHGKFIQRHLEYSPKLTTNHYLNNIAGLFFISVYVPLLKDSRRWLNFCIKELTKEIDKQVYEDGCDFEASTSYHRLALEILFYCNLLAERSGISLPKKFKQTLRKMFDVSLHCIKPNGKIPQIGDNDSGRFLVFVKRPVLEHKYLLTLASIYYKDSDFKVSHFDYDEEAFWVFGTRGKKAYDKLPKRTSALCSKGFPKAGWFIIRNNSDYCFISSGPNGQNGNGGHAHNDKLSFELTLNGQDIILDPGTYTYTAYPKERNKFRSTIYHNTIKFDDYEQNEISANAIFSLPDRVKINNAAIKEGEDEAKFEAKIQYLNFAHKRSIILNKKNHSWRIIDNISSLGKVKVKVMFHLAPNLTIDGNSILIKEMSTKIAIIEIEKGNLEKGKYDYSPEYGVKMKAEYLAVNDSVTEEPQTIKTWIRRVQ